MENSILKNMLEAKIRDNPQSLFFARLADLYLLEDRIDEAIQICQNGISAHPSYVTGYYILAKAFLLKNDLENSESAFKKVLSHDREYISAHKTLGDIMIKLGWENSAITHYKDILQIDSLEKTAHTALSNISDVTIESVELPTSKLQEEPEVFTQEIENKTQNEEEWISQIREVFPDKLADYSSPDEPDHDISKTQQTKIDETVQISDHLNTDNEAMESIKKNLIDELQEIPLINDSDESKKDLSYEKDPFESKDMDEIDVYGDFKQEHEITMKSDIINERDSNINNGKKDLSSPKDIADWKAVPEAPDGSIQENEADEMSVTESIDHTITDDTKIVDISETDFIDAIEQDIQRTELNIETSDEIVPFNESDVISTQEFISEESIKKEPVISKKGNAHEMNGSEVLDDSLIKSIEEDASSIENNESIDKDLKLEIEVPEEKEESNLSHKEMKVSDKKMETIEITEISSDMPKSKIRKPKPKMDKKSHSDSLNGKKEESMKSPKILTPTLGEIYIAQEQYDKAMDIFKQLSELHPNEKKYKDKIKFLEEKLKDMNL